MLLAIKAAQDAGTCCWFSGDGAFHRRLWQGSVLAQSAREAAQIASRDVSDAVASAKKRAGVEGRAYGTRTQLNEAKGYLYEYLLQQLPTSMAHTFRPLPSASREGNEEIYEAVARTGCAFGMHRFAAPFPRPKPGQGVGEACVHCKCRRPSPPPSVASEERGVGQNEGVEDVGGEVEEMGEERDAGQSVEGEEEEGDEEDEEDEEELCAVCECAVLWGTKGIQCGLCTGWFHYVCVGVKRNPVGMYTCQGCTLDISDMEE